MSGWAVVAFDRAGDRGALIRAMLDAMPHRGANVEIIVRDQVAAGTRTDAVVEPRSDASLAESVSGRDSTRARLSDRASIAPARPGGPFQQGEAVVVASARIDNFASLARTLAIDASCTLEALLLAAYARWDLAMCERLEGDFAFVIVDRHRIFAARDPFGTRPLFYATRGEHFYAAGEVDALLRADLPRDLDDDLILEQLLQHYTHREQTFFRAIDRVLPGHYLLFEHQHLKQHRWYHPPAFTIRLPRFADYIAEIRRLFRASIEARLESNTAILAHLSGGLDSSSIVCMAAAARPRAALTTISAIYPGLACDESRFIDAVTARVPFAGERFDGRDSSFEDYARGNLLHPGPPPTSGLAGERAIIAKTNAKVVLSGSGGDQLFFERGIFRDLAGTGRFLALYRELTAEPRYTETSATALAKDAFRPLVPDMIRGALRKRETRPIWLGPRLVDRWEHRRSPPREDRAGSHTRSESWRWLSSAPMCWNLELQELEKAKLGLEIRYPFLDARLVELVLSIPWQHRLPKGRMKALLRGAMADLLPEPIRERTHVTSFDSAVTHHVQRHFDQLTAIIRDLDAARDYLDASRVRARVEQIRKGEGEWRDASFLWDVAMLELFLRRARRG